MWPSLLTGPEWLRSVWRCLFVWLLTLLPYSRSVVMETLLFHQISWCTAPKYELPLVLSDRNLFQCGIRSCACLISASDCVCVVLIQLVCVCLCGFKWWRYNYMIRNQITCCECFLVCSCSCFCLFQLKWKHQIISEIDLLMIADTFEETCRFFQTTMKHFSFTLVKFKGAQMLRCLCLSVKIKC